MFQLDIIRAIFFLVFCKLHQNWLEVYHKTLTSGKSYMCICFTADTSAKLIYMNRQMIGYITMDNRRVATPLLNTQNAISLAIDYSTQDIYYADLRSTAENSSLVKFKLSSSGLNNPNQVSNLLCDLGLFKNV